MDSNQRRASSRLFLDHDWDRSFAYLDGRYLIFAQGFAGQTRFFSSTDLTTWTTNILNDIPNNSFSDIIKSGTKYFVSARQALFSSTDGITWTGVNYSLLPADVPQPAGTAIIDRSGRLYTMQSLGGNAYSGQRLIYSDDGATWNLYTNSFPAPFLPEGRGRLLYTGTRLLAAYFADGLFAYYDINLPAGSPGGQTFATWILTQGVPANLQGALDDPDGDGFGNGAEFALGTNPNSSLPGDIPTLVSGSTPDGALSYRSVTFIRRKATSGITVAVEGATNLAFNPTSPTTAITPVDLGNGTERVTIRGNTPISATATFFFRIKVTQP